MRPFLSLACLVALALLLAGTPLRAVRASEGGGHGGGEAKAEGKGEGKGEGGKEEGGKKKGAEEEGISGGKFEGDPVYVHMQPLILPVINDSGAQQIVTMIVDLQVKSFDKATEMHNAMPRLKDSLFQALYGGMADGPLVTGPYLNLEKIKESIKATTNRVFGEGSVSDVLVQAIMQRKF